MSNACQSYFSPAIDSNSLLHLLTHPLLMRASHHAHTTSATASSSLANLHCWRQTRMYSLPVPGTIQSVTIISVSCFVRILRYTKSESPWFSCLRVDLVFITRSAMRVAYCTEGILSSGKAFTGMPSKLITTQPMAPGCFIISLRYSCTSLLSLSAIL
ncbi:hypothetical protein FGO68_gene11641 [Halteria grandinella]|uniref:Uncharacterized protein n=1 Tax=Halteria grandinella TaxID=5974 RepID=A0A8J8T8R9_HALGN|nr:hypothetical protein FGO68_gene11641 [Halteria grandinella]